MNMNSEDLSQLNIDAVNSNLVTTDVRFTGDMTTISQVIQLLSYIKYAINYNSQQEIKVKIGNNVINTPFSFTVNNELLKEFIAKPEIEIN